MAKEYEDYTTGKGIHLKIYGVPNQLILNMSTPYDSEKPKRPFVTMKTKGGGEQKRPLKQCDEGWEEYNEQLEEWEEKRDGFREAVTYVMALQDFEYPKEFKFRPKIQLLIDQEFIKLPSNEWEMKYIWLQDQVLGQNDEIQIQWILRKFSGVPEEIIEDQKSRFWDLVSGKASRSLDNGNGHTTGSDEVSEQDQLLLEV